MQAVGGRSCGCGQRGCLESYCSATSVAARASEAIEKMAAQPSQGLTDGSTRGKDSVSMLQALKGEGGLTCQAVFDAALKGDRLAMDLVDETARYLAVGSLNFARIVDPAIIVFGGGPTSGAAGELLLQLVEKYVAELTWSVLPTPTLFALAAAGPDAGLIGAAAVARTKSMQSAQKNKSGSLPKAAL
eukprot:SAG31_NODE_2942_length_4878_cov_6.517263_5_plen_188_part_00